jgi:hypothetical protein
MINNFSASEPFVRTRAFYGGLQSILEFRSIPDIGGISFSVKIIKYDILKSVT